MKKKKWVRIPPSTSTKQGKNKFGWGIYFVGSKMFGVNTFLGQQFSGCQLFQVECMRYGKARTEAICCEPLSSLKF